MDVDTQSGHFATREVMSSIAVENCVSALNISDVSAITVNDKTLVNQSVHIAQPERTTYLQVCNLRHGVQDWGSTQQASGKARFCLGGVCVLCIAIEKALIVIMFQGSKNCQEKQRKNSTSIEDRRCLECSRHFSTSAALISHVKTH